MTTAEFDPSNFWTAVFLIAAIWNLGTAYLTYLLGKARGENTAKYEAYRTYRHDLKELQTVIETVVTGDEQEADQ